MPDPSYVHAAFSRIAAHYVTANHLLSMGADVLWRERAVRMMAEWQPRRVLDIATGTGDLALDIIRSLPGVEVLGTDFCEPMLDIARRRGLRETLVADAMHLPLEDGSFDVATAAFGLRNMSDYAAALREFHRVLQPGGHLLILELGIPGGIWAAPFRFYLHRVLPRAAAALTSAQETYSYLGRSMEAFPHGEAFLSLLKETGYEAPFDVPLWGGIAHIYAAQKPVCRS